jgi:outer membrane protein, heavy metal efflux system
MTRVRTVLASAVATATLTGCASVPKDAGFADVRRTVEETTKQSVQWDPRQPVQPPDEAALADLLQTELTADRAVQIAFAHNRDVQATLEDLGLARADLIAASTIRNPVLDGEIRFPGDPSKPFELALMQSVIDLFQLWNRKKLGRAQFEVARVRVSGAIVNFAGQVRTDYFDLLAARKVLARQETVIKTQEASTELATRQHTAGNISDLDLENEQARYEQEKLDFARAQLDELQARERLIADLGGPRRVEVKLPDEFPTIPDSELAAGDVETQVLTRRLDIQMVQREIEAAQRAISVARTAGIDDLAVGAHHEREPEGKRTTGPAARVPVPIFDRGKAQKERARAMLRQAQQRLAALQASASAEGRAALERLIEARSRAIYLRDVVIPRRDRIVKLTQVEYNAMLRGVFQLLEARKELASARREEVIAARDYWVARTDLDTAILGVGRFSVRPDAPAAARLDLSRGGSQQSSQGAHD